MTTHKEAAKMHFRRRIRTRFGGRSASLGEIDFIRRSIKNGTCFLCKDCGPVIKAIVQFQNIHVPVIYDKAMDGVVTAGVKI